MTACTCAGAFTGEIASPVEVSVAWLELADSPLAASSLRIVVSETGSARPPEPELDPTLTTAGGLDAEPDPDWLAAPATGSTACGWAWRAGPAASPDGPATSAPRIGCCC